MTKSFITSLKSIAGVTATIIALVGAAHAQNRPTPIPGAPGKINERDMTTNRNGYNQVVRRLELESLFSNPADATRAFQRNEAVAGCIVRLSGDRASSLLGGPATDDPGYARLGKAMSGRYQRCAPDGELAGLSPRLLNAALVEKLVLRDESAKFEDRAAAVDTDKATAFHGALTGQIGYDNIARCAAVYSPGLTRKVLAAEVGSEAESSALKTLFASTPECAVTDVTSVPALMQRTMLATSLYAWTHPADGK